MTSHRSHLIWSNFRLLPHSCVWISKWLSLAWACRPSRKFDTPTSQIQVPGRVSIDMFTINGGREVTCIISKHECHFRLKNIFPKNILSTQDAHTWQGFIKWKSFQEKISVKLQTGLTIAASCLRLRAAQKEFIWRKEKNNRQADRQTDSCRPRSEVK